MSAVATTSHLYGMNAKNKKEYATTWTPIETNEEGKQWHPLHVKAPNVDHNTVRVTQSCIVWDTMQATFRSAGIQYVKRQCCEAMLL